MRKICLFAIAFIFIFSISACAHPREASNANTGTGTADVSETTGAGDAMDTKTLPLDMGKDDNTRITIAMSKAQNRFIEAAVSRFQQVCPGIAIEVKYYSSMGEILTRQMEDGSMVAVGQKTDPGGEKYIKTISTELMSGAGPDIIDTMYVPCSRFAENGFLCNIKDIMGQDAEFDKADYFEGILHSAEYKGGLYSMPVGFLADFLAGKYSLPADAAERGMTLSSFFLSARETLGSKGLKDPNVLACGKERLFSLLFKKSYDRFVNEADRKCDFKSGDFSKLIRQIREAADKKLIFSSEDDVGKYKGTENLFFPMESSYDSNYLAYCKEPGSTNNVYAFPGFNAESFIGAEAFESYGISSNSDSKGAAWKFLKFLVSEEMQTSPEFFIFPMNKNAMLKKIERERVSKTGYISNADDPIFSRIALYPPHNNQIFKIVEEETKKYFDGQRSAEETAGIIQSRVDMVVKE